MAKTVGGKEYNEEGLVKKTKRRLKELFHGERTYLPKQKKETPKEMARKPYLKAGISENELKGLRPNLYKKEK